MVERLVYTEKVRGSNPLPPTGKFIMKLFTDLHIHSKFARGCSKDLTIENIIFWSKLKGLQLLGTGDFTHPLWLKELKEKLIEVENGIFQDKKNREIYFILTSEINLIFLRNREVKRMHLIIGVPSFEAAEKINNNLRKFGSIESDGRPTLKIDVIDFISLVFSIDEKIMIIPAHIWTPWFSLFGSKSGFNSITEAFADYSQYITALETGLSSNPQMNWRLSQLDNFSIVSFSDAHSAYPHRLGREATFIEIENISYDNVYQALKNKNSKNKIILTIEFFPEEGKYHFDGHRLCGISFSPKESKKFNNICPVCYKPLVIGVMHRVENLADRDENFIDQNRPTFYQFVPLSEIIAKLLKTEPTNKKVLDIYQNIVKKFVNEFEILIKKYQDEEFKKDYPEISNIIDKIHQKKIKIIPGYDGEYGKIIFEDINQPDKKLKQESLF